MLEIGELIGQGSNAVFFRIRNNPDLGVRILLFASGEKSRQILEEELKRAQALQQLNLPIPKYVEVAQIKVPEHIDKIFDKAESRNVGLSYKERSVNNLRRFGTVYGLLMEYIDSDLTLVSPRRLGHIFEIEKKKIESYGIKTSIDTFHNILWSKQKGRIYFTDFEYWDISALHSPTRKIKSWLSRVFG